MYNVVSKLAYIIIAPENWIMALLVWIFVTKSTIVRKRLVVSVILLILIFGNEFLFITLVNSWQPKPVTLAKNASYDAGILLGGSTSFDKFGRGFLNSTSDRFIETCLLYKTKKIKKIIITGGSNAPNDPKDADFQYNRMVELGIPAEDIIVEDSSTTTFENAAFTKVKIAPMPLRPPFILITSAMHIPRAVRVFTKAGIPVIPFPSNYNILQQRFDFGDYFIPKVSTLLSWNSFMKEIVGILGYKLFNKA